MPKLQTATIIAAADNMRMTMLSLAWRLSMSELSYANRYRSIDPSRGYLRACRAALAERAWGAEGAGSTVAEGSAWCFKISLNWNAW